MTWRMTLVLSASRRNDAPESVSVRVLVGVGVLRDNPTRRNRRRRKHRKQECHRESAAGGLHRVRILQVRALFAGDAEYQS